MQCGGVHTAFLQGLCQAKPQPAFARGSHAVPGMAGPFPGHGGGDGARRWARAGVTELERAEMDSGSQEMAGTPRRLLFQVHPEHAQLLPAVGHPGLWEPAALERTKILSALGTCCPWRGPGFGIPLPREQREWCRAAARGPACAASPRAAALPHQHLQQRSSDPLHPGAT